MHAYTSITRATSNVVPIVIQNRPTFHARYYFCVCSFFSLSLSLSSLHVALCVYYSPFFPRIKIESVRQQVCAESGFFEFPVHTYTIRT